MWSREKDDLLRRALICANRADLRASGGYRTWEQVAQIMYKLEDKLTTVQVRECQDRYQDHLIFTMEDVDLSTFALMYPPWRTEEFETLRSFLHYSIPGGKRGDPELSWDEITRLMNDAHIIIDDFTGVSNVNHFSRTYLKRDVFLAWRVRIRPRCYGSEEPGAKDKYPQFLGIGDPVAEGQSSQTSGAKDQSTQDKPARYSGAGYLRPIRSAADAPKTPDQRQQDAGFQDQGTLDKPPRYSSTKSQESQESYPRYPSAHRRTRDMRPATDGQGIHDKRPRYPSTQFQGAKDKHPPRTAADDQETQDRRPRYSSTEFQGTKDKHLPRTAADNQETQQRRPLPSSSTKQIDQGTRNQYVSAWHRPNEDIYSATDEPNTQATTRHPIMTISQPHDEDYLDPGVASTYLRSSTAQATPSHPITTVNQPYDEDYLDPGEATSYSTAQDHVKK